MTHPVDIAEREVEMAFIMGARAIRVRDDVDGAVYECEIEEFIRRSAVVHCRGERFRRLPVRVWRAASAALADAIRQPVLA